MKPGDPSDLKLSSREAAAWGGLALLKRMLDGIPLWRMNVATAPRQAPTVASVFSNSSGFGLRGYAGIARRRPRVWRYQPTLFGPSHSVSLPLAKLGRSRGTGEPD